MILNLGSLPKVLKAIHISYKEDNVSLYLDMAHSIIKNNLAHSREYAQNLRESIQWKRSIRDPEKGRTRNRL